MSLASNNKRILVVDDDVHIRRVLEVKLRSRGHIVSFARDGEEGLKLINEQRPDVVITDINMPRMNGEQMVRQADALKKDRTFLTIVMTARISKNDQTWTMEMKDTVLVEKPFSPARMIECIDEYFGKDR
ncbi:MAG: response regulator [Pseudomonadota bacterium]